jgi:hypothetical protein
MKNISMWHVGYLITCSDSIGIYICEGIYLIYDFDDQRLYVIQ